MILKLTDIDGESKIADHEDEIDVIGWSWGASMPATLHSGGGGGAGKVDIQDINITKYVDKSSHNLLKAVALGRHIPEATLIVRKAGEAPLDFLKLTLTDCLISSLATGGSPQEDRLTENITIAFVKFLYEYTPQKEDGSGDSVLPFNFNIETNAEE